MDYNMQAIVDFNAQTTAPIPHHEPTTQYLASWRRAPPPDTHPSQTVDAANNVPLFVYQSPSHGVGGSFRQIPSPAASRSESAAPQPAESTNENLIKQLRIERDQLISDKDRLMTEKDALVNEKLRIVEDRERTSHELLNSKNQLWQEYYEAVRVRDEEITKLKEDYGWLERELGVQQKKNRRLARALSDYMEKEDADARPKNDDQDKQEHEVRSVLGPKPVSKASKAEQTASWLDNVTKPDKMETESRKQMRELFGGTSPGKASSEHGPDGEPPTKRPRISGTDVFSRDHEGQKVASPVAQPKSVIDLDSSCYEVSIRQTSPRQLAEFKPQESIENRSALAPAPHSSAQKAAPQDQNDAVEFSGSLGKLQDECLIPMNFTIRPVIRSESASVRYGQLEQLHDRVIDSIYNTMSMLQQKVQEGKRKWPVAKKVKGCCQAWTYGSNDYRWTKEHPRLFACRACFRAQRACFLWQGDGVWHLLPLPPEVRQRDAAYTDPDYYISSQDLGLRAIWQVWVQSSGPKLTPKHVAAASSVADQDDHDSE
ncbi:hypothetical protein CKM354_000284300 [Cercospora kikuchii]|uniref:Uncharacterized protein n=1 Tax=Cercospora kikuchii TaxID=84275 RepID=A0A9P3CB16_9PEZI|nr:uncharacterized protein CKM354_000284300 [Cercospora kikuchii]GIZ39461.1 hypothetical protein CKM354_000284300 [Cercospora kikuchii]